MEDLLNRLATHHLLSGDSSQMCIGKTWPSTIMLRDVRDFPAKSDDVLAEGLCMGTESYLKFFSDTRGYERKMSTSEKNVWDIFSKGSVMMYFESLFVNILDKKTPSGEDIVLMKYMKILGEMEISKWNGIVRQIGAMGYPIFAKNPREYAKLPFRNKNNMLVKDMTDMELMERASVLPGHTSSNGYIGVDATREEILSLVRK
jgi:hypothetical protein